MIDRYLRALLAGAALALTAASASDADTKPAEDTVLGFTRPQVAAVTVCYGRSNFAMAAFIGFQKGLTVEQAKASVQASGEAAAMIFEEIDKVYAARPKEVRAWTESRFAECLAGKSVPIPAADATGCFDISFWVALLVRSRMQASREATLDAIVKKDADPKLREFVGAEYDVQAKGDQIKSATYTVGNFLTCANLRAGKGQPAPPAASKN